MIGLGHMLSPGVRAGAATRVALEWRKEVPQGLSFQGAKPQLGSGIYEDALSASLWAFPEKEDLVIIITITTYVLPLYFFILLLPSLLFLNSCCLLSKVK